MMKKVWHIFIEEEGENVRWKMKLVMKREENKKQKEKSIE